MVPKVATASAFAMSGAVWLTGIALYDGQSWDASFLLVVGGYVALGSVLLGIRSDRLISTLAGLWVAAVGVFALTFGGATTALDLLLSVVAALVYTLIYGTVPFVGWVAFGLMGLRFLGHLPDPAPAAHRELS